MVRAWRLGGHGAGSLASQATQRWAKGCPPSSARQSNDWLTSRLKPNGPMDYGRWYESSAMTSRPLASAVPQAADAGCKRKARTVETAALSGVVKPFEGPTDLFILPGYEFKVIDAMITNFHLPRSTLIMLVSAFAGRDIILSAYNTAMEEGYRFYSFGDAMLII